MGRQQSTANPTKGSIRLDRSPFRAFSEVILWSIPISISTILLLWFVLSDDFTASGFFILLFLVLLLDGFAVSMMKTYSFPYLKPGYIEISSTQIRQFEQDRLITIISLDPFVSITFQRQHVNIIDGYIFERGEELIKISIYAGYQRTDIERILPFILKLINQKEITWEGKSVVSTYKIVE